MTESLFDVAGRRVFVAGGAQGLGAALCGALAERGAQVVVADLRAKDAERLAGELPGEGHYALGVDITDEASVDAAIDECLRRDQRLDVVVNSAGVADFGPAVELEAERFARTISVNLNGAFLLSRCAARHMLSRGEGSIIHIASVSSTVVNPEYSAYSSSKAGLAQLVRLLALEWAKQGVRINAIGPAVVETPLTAEYTLANEDRRNYALSKIPMGRFCQPQDLFGALLLLASSAGQFITGQTFYVDGGRTLL